jgi:hypothetical protein
MSNLLFNTYAVKGNLKFYKIENDQEDSDEKITVSIGITANHQIEANIYEDLSAFLEKLLIKDYMNEQTYQAKKAHAKAMIKQEKEQAKREKQQEKQKKSKTTKTTKKVKSLY